MNIKDVQDAMEDLIVAHGCAEETVIYTATGRPIDGFDFGEDGEVYVINSLGENADSDTALRLRNMRAQRDFYKGALERYQDEILRLKGQVEEFHLASTVLLSQISEARIPGGSFARGRKLLTEAMRNVESIN